MKRIFEGLEIYHAACGGAGHPEYLDTEHDDYYCTRCERTFLSDEFEIGKPICGHFDPKTGGCMIAGGMACDERSHKTADCKGRV